MALLSKLKSLLGIGGGADDRRTETTVTVEHDPDETVDTEVTQPDPEAEPDADDTHEADDTTAAEPNTETAAESDDETAPTDESAADPPVDEADAVAVDDAESDSAVDDAAPDSTVDDAAAAADAADEYSDEPLDSIKGIGPAYSERLHEAGITSVAELADGDAEEIGEAISVSPKTVGNWIDRAAEK